MAKSLVDYTNKQQATQFLRNNFKGFLEYPGELDQNVVHSIAKLFAKVDRKPHFDLTNAENNDWDEFSAYLRIGREDSLYEERFNITEKTIASLKSRIKPKEKDQVHSIAKITLSSDLKDEDLSKATDEFFANKDFKLTDKNAGEVYGKYHYLFLEKSRLADQLLENERLEKELNRSDFYMKGRSAFLAIIAIAAILILFSIRQIIKSKIEQNS